MDIVNCLKKGFNIYPKSNTWEIFLLFLVLAVVLAVSFITISGNTNFISTNPTTQSSITPEVTIRQSDMAKKSTSGTEADTHIFFYPGFSEVTINEPNPTIIGKINQSRDLFLDTKFGIEKSPINGEEEYYLRFIPGRVKRLQFSINSTPVENVYGFSLYPTVGCKTSFTYDSKLNRIPDDRIYITENDCILNKKEDIPPVLFFFKPPVALTEGKHIVTISHNSQLLETLVLNVDKGVTIPAYIRPEGNEKDVYMLLEQSNNCPRGYYYETNYLHTPLPREETKNVFYYLSFPQIIQEKGTGNRRIYVSFDNSQFDLFLPHSSVFYGKKTSKDGTLDPMKVLFLPEEHLVFADGSPAFVKQLSPESSWYREYFDIVPIDILGRTYPTSFFRWETYGSSGCDG